jgi:transposase
LPRGVPSGGFGPRAQAIASYLSGVGRQSKRLVKAMMKDLCGLDMCIGSVSACENAVSEAVAQPVEQARQYAQDSAVLYADETSWWQKHIKSWLWVAVAPLVTVFMIHSGRGRKAARTLLGQFKGILVTDRWKPYRVHNGLRQFCWAHLLRDFVGFSELKGKAGLIGGLLVEKTELMFKWWHRIRDGTIDRATFRRKMSRLRIEVENLLIDGELCGQRPISGKCKNILSESECLWVFVDHEGVEPTNNVAERQVRHGVMWRRLCFGTQSEGGSRFAERIMTVHATCRQQGRNILDYLTEACAAQINHGVPPSLLPSACQSR